MFDCSFTWGYARGAAPQAVIFWAFSPGELGEIGGQRTEIGQRGKGQRVSVVRCFGMPSERVSAKRAVGAWEESGVAIPGALPAGWYELGLWALGEEAERAQRTEHGGRMAEGESRKQKAESRNLG